MTEADVAAVRLRRSSLVSFEHWVSGLKRWQIVLGLQALDLLMICAAGSLSLHHCTPLPAASSMTYTSLLLLVALASFAHFGERNIYRLSRLIDVKRNIRSTSLRWSLIFVALAMSVSLGHAPLVISYVSLGGFFLIGGIFLGVQRCVSAHLIRRWMRSGHVVKSIVVVGATAKPRRHLRIFKFDEFLRQSRLDHLPGLINVLRGETSLVAPQPQMVGQKLQDEVFFEHVEGNLGRRRVKPGMTGWAERNGWQKPALTTNQTQREVEYEFFYIENWPFRRDLFILIRAVCSGSFRKLLTTLATRSFVSN